MLGWAIEQRCRSRVAFTIRDLCSEILDPPDELDGAGRQRSSPPAESRLFASVAGNREGGLGESLPDQGKRLESIVDRVNRFEVSVGDQART